jgi:ADP-ribose pyrophosphatase
LPRKPCERRWRVPEEWQVLSSKTAFSSAWLRVRQDTVRLPNGLELDDYYVVEQHDFVKIFPVTADGRVVFVREYKHGAGRVLLQLPAGFIEPGEDPGQAAVRELREETGCAGELRKVGQWIVDPTRTPTVEHVFLGRVAAVGQQRLERTEDIEVVLIPPSDIPGLIQRGELIALSSIATALYCLPLLGSL